MVLFQQAVPFTDRTRQKQGIIGMHGSYTFASNQANIKSNNNRLADICWLVWWEKKTLAGGMATS